MNWCKWQIVFYVFFLAFVFPEASFKNQKAFDRYIQSKYSTEVKLCDPTHLQKRIELGSTIFLDTRKSQEYRVSQLPGALWVGYKDFSLDRVAHLDKEKEIIVYCSMGIRSDEIALKLIEAGYRNVKNLYGGVFYWINLGNKLEKKGIETLDIHPFNSLWGYWLVKGNKVYE